MLRPKTLGLMGKALGAILMLVSIIYVGWSLHASGALTAPVWREPSFWWRTLLASLLYGGALALIGSAWTRLVTSVTPVRIGTLEGIRVYAASHLYKYLPSNLLHYAGRQMMLKRRGVEHAATAWASLAEGGAIVIAAGLVAIGFGYDYLAAMLERLASDHASILLASLAAVGLAAAGLVLFRSRLPPALARFVAPEARRAICIALVLHAAFFIVAGGALALIAVVTSGAPPLAALIAISAGSWVVGFMTPGAAAGLGVREAILITGLAQTGMSVGEAGVLAVAYRVATTFGDLAFAATGRWLAPPPSRD